MLAHVDTVAANPAHLVGALVKGCMTLLDIRSVPVCCDDRRIDFYPKLF
jgi:hypothetical protein